MTVTHTAYLDNGTATGLTADNDKIPSESWVVNNSPLEIQMDMRDSQESLYETQENSLWYHLVSLILLVNLLVLVFLVVLLSPVILLILLLHPDAAVRSKKLEKLLRTSLRFQIFTTVFLLRVFGSKNCFRINSYRRFLMEKEKVPGPETRARRRKVIQQLRLMDDVLMRLCLQDNKPAVQLILRILMDKPNLEVQELETQREATSISGRSVRFDVWARDGDAVYNIEIERTDERASAKRARYHSAMLDSGLLKSGEEFTKLVETFVIFITENDIFGKGLPLYRFDRYCEQTAEYLEDGTHILYVNGQYRGDDDLGKLMSDFNCTNVEDMVYTELAERVGSYKRRIEGGRNNMSAWDELIKEEREEARTEGEQRMGALITKLREQGLIDDAFKAASDPEYRNKLYKQYNL